MSRKLPVIDDDESVPVRLSDAEHEFIDILREQKPSNGLRVVISLVDGAWEVSMSAPVKSKNRTIRGSGKTFSEAWNRAHRTEE